MKISSIEAFPICYPTVGRFKFLEGPTGAPVGRPAVLVKITAENGVIGWGESVPIPKWSYETLESATNAVRTYIAPELIGRDGFDIVGAHEIMNRVIAPGFSTGMPIAKAGIDIALHDLVGKLLNISLPRLWGNQGVAEITLSWTLNPVSLDDLAAMVEEGWWRGYRNFNVKVAPDPAYDLELCRRVKELVPHGFLWADANGGYDLAAALKIAPKLADLGVDILESPLRPNEIAGYQRLKRQGALPIVMDEGVISPHDLIEFIRLDMLDGVALKPARCGGLLSARRQIEIIQEAGLLFLGSGLTDPDVSLAASLALYGAYHLKFPAALNGPQFLSHSVMKHPFHPVEGKLSVPQDPGLGVEVDEEKMNAILAK